MEKINSLFKSVLNALEKFQFLPPLAARLGLGALFFQSGLGKLNHISRTIQFFESLNIPLPQIQAPLIALLEISGGIALVLGWGTRAASFILCGIMTVALLTAKADEISGPLALIEIPEFLYLLLLTFLVTQGAGRISVDALSRRN